MLDIAIHDVLSLWADHRTGLCFASAEKIKALCPAEFSYKSIQRSLAKMEKLGWIKRWMIRGKRGNYPVLVCRYFVRDASMTWMSTSGEATTDWRDVKFDAVHDESFNRPQSCPPSVHSDVHDLSGVQEGKTENREASFLTDLLTSEIPCCLKTENPWQYSGVVFKNLPKRFRTKEFDEEVRLRFEA